MFSFLQHSHDCTMYIQHKTNTQTDVFVVQSSSMDEAIAYTISIIMYGGVRRQPVM